MLWKDSLIPGALKSEAKCKGFTGNKFVPGKPSSCVDSDNNDVGSIIPGAADNKNICEGLTGNTYTPTVLASCRDKNSGIASTIPNATLSENACKNLTGNIFTPAQPSRCMTAQGVEISQTNGSWTNATCTAMNSNDNTFVPSLVQSCEPHGDATSKTACEGIDNGNIYEPGADATCSGGGDASSKLKCEGMPNGNTFIHASAQHCTNGGNSTSKIACEGVQNNNVFTPPQAIRCSGVENRSGTDGGEVFLIHGINFGPPGSRESQSVYPLTAYLEQVTYGQSVNHTYDVTEHCETLNYTLIKCRTIPGTGALLDLSVKVRGQTNIPRAHARISYARPVIINVSDSNKTNADPEEFRFVVTAQFAGLADPGAKQSLLFNMREDSKGNPVEVYKELSPSGRNARYRKGPYEVLQFDLPWLVENMRGANVTVRLKVTSPGGSNVQVSDPIYWSYLKPVIKRIHVKEGPTAGTKLVIIVGSNFGGAGKLELFQKKAATSSTSEVVKMVQVEKNESIQKYVNKSVIKLVRVESVSVSNFTETFTPCLQDYADRCWCKDLRCPDGFARFGNGSMCVNITNSDQVCDLGHCFANSNSSVSACDEVTPNDVVVQKTHTYHNTTMVETTSYFEYETKIVNETQVLIKNITTASDDGTLPFVALDPLDFDRKFGHYLVCYRPLVSIDLNANNGPPHCSRHVGKPGHNASLVPAKPDSAKSGYTHEQITMVFRGSSGSLRVNRGYQVSERASFEDLTPTILNVESAMCLENIGNSDRRPKWCSTAVEKNKNWPLGSQNIGILPTRGGVIKITCKYCAEAKRVTVVLDLPLSAGNRGKEPKSEPKTNLTQDEAFRGRGCYEKEPMPGTGDKPRIRCPCYRENEEGEWLIDETKIGNEAHAEYPYSETDSVSLDVSNDLNSTNILQQHKKTRFACYAPAGVGDSEDSYVVLLKEKQESEPYHIGYVPPKISKTVVEPNYNSDSMKGYESNQQNFDGKTLYGARSLFPSRIKCNNDDYICSNTEGTTAIKVTGTNLGDSLAETTWCVLDSDLDRRRVQKWRPLSISNDGDKDTVVCVVPKFKKKTDEGGILLGSERRWFALEVGGQFTNLTHSWDDPPKKRRVRYLPPVVMKVVTPDEVPSSGNINITIEGYNFDLSGETMEINFRQPVGGRRQVIGCTNITVQQLNSYHKATCLLQQGAGKALALVLRVSDQCHAGRRAGRNVGEVDTTAKCDISDRKLESIDYDPPLVNAIFSSGSMSTKGNRTIVLSCREKTCNFGTSSDGRSSCKIQIIPNYGSTLKNRKNLKNEFLEIVEPDLDFGVRRRSLLNGNTIPSDSKPYKVPKTSKYINKGEVLSRNHTHIVLRTPEAINVGSLVNMYVVAVIEGQSSDKDEGATISFGKPQIHSLVFPLSNVMKQGQVDLNGFDHRVPTSGCAEWKIDMPRGETKRGCHKRATVRIEGVNFGRNLTWITENKPLIETEDGTGRVTGATVLYQTHSRIDIFLPPGMGKTVLRVFQMREVSKNVKTLSKCREICEEDDNKEWCNFHEVRESECHLGRVSSQAFIYSKPIIRLTKWSPDIATGGSGNIFDGAGSAKSLSKRRLSEAVSVGLLDNKLFLFGDHLGEQAPPSGTLSINISDVPCDEPTWHSHSSNSVPPGRPYLSCRPRPARVGEKRVSLNVALQAIEIFKLETGKPLEARCSKNFYGKRDEYCVECWHYFDSMGNRINAANCSGQYDEVTMGTVEPRAVAGYDLLPPPACQNGECREMPDFSPNIELSRLGENRVPENCMAEIDDEFGTLRVPEECNGASLRVGEICDSLRLNVNLTSDGLEWRVATIEEEEADSDLLELRSQRRICPYIMPCEPKEACIQQFWSVDSTKQFISDVLPPDLSTAITSNESDVISNFTNISTINLEDNYGYSDFSSCAEGYVSYYRSWLPPLDENSGDPYWRDPEDVKDDPRLEDDLPCPSGSIKLDRPYGAFTGLPVECEGRRFCEDKELFSGEVGVRSFDTTVDGTLVAPEWSSGRCFAPRCGECNPKSHFRLDGICEPCPKCAWCLPVLLICGAITCGCGFYMFQRIGASPAVLNIGIDYFQVLSTFAKSKVRWPVEILYLLKLMNWVNFDIDMTAPECFARAFLTFERKWWIKVSIPFTGVVICFCCIMFLRIFGCFDGRPVKRNAAGQVTICSYLGCLGDAKKSDASGNNSALNNSTGLAPAGKEKKRRSKRKNRKGDRHVPLKALLIEMFITIIYFLYLVITRTAIDIFNCQATVPATGNLYMVSLPHEKCYAEGGVQTRLVLPGLGVLIFYCIGFPSAIWILFRRKRKVIYEDQLLRATGRGDSYTENSYYEFRKSYSKLYYAYKPESYFWIEMIILRKFLLVVIGAIFRNNPSFQMATCLMVLFASLVFQVHRQPFMGYRERAEIVKQSMESRVLRETKELSAMELVHHMGSNNAEKEMSKIQKKRRQISQTQYLMESQHRLLYSRHRICCNYNVVEEVFLVCGVLVNLCGMMFDTSYLKDPANDTTKTVISALTITLIVASLIYWIVVLIYEICTGAKNKKTRTKLQWATVKGRARNLVKGGMAKRAVALHPKVEQKHGKVSERPKINHEGTLEPAKAAELEEPHVNHAFEALDGLFFDLLDEHDDDHDISAEQGRFMQQIGQAATGYVATEEELLTNLVVKEGRNNGEVENVTKVIPSTGNKQALSTMKRLRVKSIREKGMDRKILRLSAHDHETMGDIVSSYRSHEESLEKRMDKQRNKSLANTMNRVQARRQLKSSKAMRNVEVFKHCSDEQLASVIDSMSCKTYSKGEKIVQQGEIANVFYIITQGKASVWQKNLTNMLRGGSMVGELGELAHFGENALVNAVKELDDNMSSTPKLKELRNASVIVSSKKCTVMALPGSALRKLMEEGAINRDVLTSAVSSISSQRDKRTAANRVLKKMLEKRRDAQKVEESRRLLPDTF